MRPGDHRSLWYLPLPCPALPCLDAQPWHLSPAGHRYALQQPADARGNVTGKSTKAATQPGPNSPRPGHRHHLALAGTSCRSRCQPKGPKLFHVESIAPQDVRLLSTPVQDVGGTVTSTVLGLVWKYRTSSIMVHHFGLNPAQQMRCWACSNLVSPPGACWLAGMVARTWTDKRSHEHV